MSIKGPSYLKSPFDGLGNQNGERSLQIKAYNNYHHLTFDNPLDQTSILGNQANDKSILYSSYFMN